MICAIHQPNFIPWTPYFEKIAQCDVFVIMRHCKFRKNDYQNRFNLHNQWYTMSVVKETKPIFVKKYYNYSRDWMKIKKSLVHQYPVLKKFDHHICEWVYKTNIAIILQICNALNIQTKIMYDNPTYLTGTERLVDICKKVGATTYLSGPMGKSYLNLSKFDNAHINVTFFEPTKKTHILEEL